MAYATDVVIVSQSCIRGCEIQSRLAKRYVVNLDIQFAEPATYTCYIGGREYGD